MTKALPTRGKYFRNPFKAGDNQFSGIKTALRDFARCCRGFSHKYRCVTHRLTINYLMSRHERLLKSVRGLLYYSRCAAVGDARRVRRPSCRHEANVDYTFCFPSRFFRPPPDRQREKRALPTRLEFAYSAPGRRPISGAHSHKKCVSCFSRSG